jgi:ribosomal protein S18 acetylase RimI-like enzyme
MPVNPTHTVSLVKIPTSPTVPKPTLPTELQFRPAAESDWPAIWPFGHEIVAAGDTYSYDPATDSDAARQMWLPSGEDETWLVSVSDEVLGSYHLSPNQAGPGAHVANASYMVSSRARGHGVGRAMVEHSITRASERGYRGIQFNAVATTNVYAIKLYHDLGFATIGTIPGGFRHPLQGFVDLLIMYRGL